jgi:hypothetical protein
MTVNKMCSTTYSQKGLRQEESITFLQRESQEMAARSLSALLAAAATGRFEGLQTECQKSGRHVIEAAKAWHFIRGNQILIPAVSLLVLL